MYVCRLNIIYRLFLKFLELRLGLQNILNQYSLTRCNINSKIKGLISVRHIFVSWDLSLVFNIQIPSLNKSSSISYFKPLDMLKTVVNNKKKLFWIGGLKHESILNQIVLNGQFNWIAIFKSEKKHLRNLTCSFFEIIQMYGFITTINLFLFLSHICLPLSDYGLVGSVGWV